MIAICYLYAVLEPDADDSPRLIDDLGFLLSRAGGLVISSTNDALAPLDLKVRSYSVLVSAAEHRDGVNQRRLAEILALDPSQMVGIVDDLETRGLVERRPDPVDRRNKLIVATRDGRALRSRAQRAAGRAQTEFFADVEPSVSTQLRATLQAILFPHQS